MKGPLKYFGFLIIAAGLLTAARGSFLAAAGLALFFLIFLSLVYSFQYYFLRYRPRHLEARLKDSLDKAPAPKVQADGAGVSAPQRLAGLVAKPSLLEAIGKEALSGQDMKTISERSLDYLSRYLRAGTILFLSRRRDKIVVLAARGPNADILLGSEYELEGSLAAIVAGDDGTTLNIPNLSIEIALGFKDELGRKLTEWGVMSLIMVAVGKEGLLVLASDRFDSFTKFDETAVEGVAFQLSYLVENIRQAKDLKQSAEELDKLLNSVNEINAGGNLTEILKSTLNSAVEMSGAGSGSFLLFDEQSGRLSLEAAVGLPESATAVEIGLGEGIAGWVAAHRKPVMIKDLDSDDASRVGMGSGKVAVAMALPVLLGDRLIGVLNLGSKRAGHEFASKSLTQVVRLLGQTGAAIAAGQATHEWQSIYFDTVKALSQVIESRDPFNRGHAVDVSRYASSLAQVLNLSKEEVSTIEMAGLLHDIGVAGITDTIFRQDRPLNSVERLLIRSHPRLGIKALSEIKRLRSVLPIILHHHENFDGTGYASGLKGDEIPMGARILAIAEAYAAMTADRPYRQAKSQEEIIDELRREAGTQFDPQIVYAFCRLLEDRALSGEENLTTDW